MAARPESATASTRLRRGAGGLLIGLVAGIFGAAETADAAGAKAQARATVIEAIHVNGLIGVPVTAADLIVAWRAAPGTNSGLPALRLPALLLPDDAAGATPAYDAAFARTLGSVAAVAGAPVDAVLQHGLVAAVSAITYEPGEGHAAQLSITVAFN
ncbi:MAG: hypothetical protein JO224_00420 [Pelomonas sp.]|nr:hypothetical protein [Roseateles sp.]